MYEIAVSVGAMVVAFIIRDFVLYQTFIPLHILIILLGVGSGFILHELGHKYVAMHYGSYAAYRMWPTGLMFMLFSALLGFIFAAPGAVYIYAPYMGRKQYGLISIAGPMTNALLAFVFILAFIATPITLLKFVFIQCAFINVSLGLFNMIPIFPLDGSKVIAWSVGAWAGGIGILGILFMLTMGIMALA
ncbi:MAG: site-2 protease family protein [Candidatus Micrarchaeia archaeon]